MTKKILAVEDQPNWCDFLKSMLRPSNYELTIVGKYEEAENLIRKTNYDLAIININLLGNLDIRDHFGVKLLEILHREYFSVPRIVLTGDTTGRIYRTLILLGVDEVLIKSQFTGSQFCDAVCEAINNYSGKTLRIKGKERMIIELFNEATISAGISFIFDRLGKFMDRLNDDKRKKIKDKKAKIEEYAKKGQMNRNVVLTLQNQIKELKMLLPEDMQIDSIESFISWVEDRIDANFEDLLGVSQLIFLILKEKRKMESDLMRRDKLAKMESALKIEISEFKQDLEIGDIDSKRKRVLYERIINALDILKK